MRLLVTGASRGIGRAVARRLHARGCKLALSARQQAHLSPVLGELPGSVGVAAELTRADEVERLVPRALEALGGLDGLVHSAGVVHYGPAVEISGAALDEQLAVNFSAGFKLTQHVARALVAAGRGGSIVHVVSTLALRPAADTAAYAASKAALIAATRAFALELGPAGVRVNAVAPGIIDTEMVRVLRGAGHQQLSAAETQRRLEQQQRELAALHPIGRLGTAEEVAEAVEYVLFAQFATGSVLVVDGGLTL